MLENNKSSTTYWKYVLHLDSGKIIRIYDQKSPS